jgi:hypothetical protein
MKKTYLFILGLGLIFSSSCKKDSLYPESETQVSDQNGQPFSTPARIQSQALALYASLRSGQFLGGRFQVYNDVKADNWINFSNNQITASNTWSENVNTTSDEVQNLWAQAYRAINDSNLFIDGMLINGTAVVGDVRTAEYVAEAKFVRALSYYCLLQMYARPYADGNGSKPGVPLRLVGQSSFKDFSIARSTVAEVYAQIIKDLNEAETGAPATFTAQATNVTRAHRNTIIALKTRVYLSMGKYAELITEANKIVSPTAPFSSARGTATGGVTFELQPNIVNVFRTPYVTTESIFSMPFNATTETPGGQNAMAYYFYQNASTPGLAEFYLNPTGVISDPTWKATDARRTGLLFVNGARTYVSKFSTPNPFPDFVPVMRYSEVLLNLAEARARVNGLDPQAIALLNAVRGRSDASTVFTAASLGTGATLVNTILQERNIEFLGEGLRNIDLMRTLSPIPGKGIVPAVPVNDPKYIWPISGEELLYNSLITNN